MNAPAPHPAPRRRHHVPRPLAALLVAVLLLGSAWVMVNPMMQAPDEQIHLGYTQYLAETGKLPGKSATNGPLSSEEFLAADVSNAGRAAQQLGLHMSWDRSVYRAWQAQSAALPEGAKADGGGLGNAASSNPPLYYLTTVPAYLVASGSDFFGRLSAVRMVSVLWLLLTVVAAWLLAGELFGRRRLLQTGVAGAVGFAPMNLFVSSSVTPDAALFASWGLVLWLGARLLNRGITRGGVLALFLALGLASVIKATSYALLPAVLLVLVVAIVRGRRAVPRTTTEGTAKTFPDGQTDEPASAPTAAAVPASSTTPVGSVGGLLTVLALAGFGLLITVGTWIVVSRIVGVAALAQASDVAGTGGSGGGGIRGLLSYLWQFYLPKLPGMDPVLGQASLPVYDVLLKGTWAAFGWREVLFPGWVYVLLAVVSVGVGALAVAGLWRDRRRADWMIGVFFVLVAAGLMAGLHWTEFGKGGFGFIQGRYLLPLAPLAAAALVRAIQWAPRPRQGALIGASLGGLLVLNLFSLGLILERFYA